MPPPFITKREFARAWHIAKVIGRYGLIPLAEASVLGRALGIRFWRRMDPRFQHLPPQVRLRMALEDLGTTYIKLGQVLSARSDLLPPEYLAELAKLQDDVPPLPYERIEPVFRVAFGFSPLESFSAFNTVPVASASIGQVYEAMLYDGTAVMVKIQRPGVVEEVNTDLSLLHRAADLAHKHHWLERFDFPALVREFSAILQDELLYTLEAHNAETLSAEMADHPKVIFPEVHWPLTARQVLTTKRIVGYKITDLPALREAGIDTQEVAAQLANSMLEQILLHGMFHGDPHPGNLLVTPDGTLAFLDTGMVGRLDHKTRETLIELAVSIFDQDIDAILGHLQSLGMVKDLSNLPDLRRDLSRLIMKYYFLPRKELRLGELLQRMNSLLFEHRIRMAYEFGLMAKALFLAEGVAQELDPDFDYNRVGRPVIEEVRRRYFSPKELFNDLVREWRGMRLQVVNLPRRLSTVLDHLERGTLRVRQSDDSWEIKAGAQNVLINRIGFAGLIVGLLVASAIILASPTAEPWLRYFAIGTLVADVIFMFMLLVAILRSGRF
jgi:ubiquinone biosynthesis protein